MQLPDLLSLSPAPLKKGVSSQMFPQSLTSTQQSLTFHQQSRWKDERRAEGSKEGEEEEERKERGGDEEGREAGQHHKSAGGKKD